MSDTKTIVKKPKPSLRESFRALPFVFRFLYQADKRGTIIVIANELLQFPLSMASVFGLKYLTDALTALDARRSWIGAGVMAAIALGYVVYGFVRGHFNDALRYRVEIATKRRFVEKMSSVSYAKLEDPAFQTLAHAYAEKSYILSNMTMSITWILRNLLEALGLLTVFFFLPWQAVVLFVVAQVLRIWMMRRVREWSWDLVTMETREGRRASYYQRLLTTISDVYVAKAFGMVKPLFDRWKKLVAGILDQKLKTVRRSANAQTWAFLLEALGFVAVLWLVVDGVLSRVVTASAAFVFIATYQRFQGAFQSAADNGFWLLQESVSLPLFEKFFATDAEKDEGRSVPDGPLSVAFEDVWFRYPGTQQDVLKGISLTFNQGDHLALVGLNGSGKTTLLKLLMRVYEPTQGRILVNGIDLQKIKPSAWRKALAVMTQDVPRMDDTLREQVHYGDLSPFDDGRYRTALKASGLDQVSDEFPRKMETHAGKQYAMPEDEPIELSGGQNQILAMARTLYRDASIYVFDEPTSAVDAEKEERFFEALPAALQSQAVIFVSHRFSTLRRAERVIVIDQGRVIEDGTHEELMAKQGRYAELFTLQAKLYQ